MKNFLVGYKNAPDLQPNKEGNRTNMTNVGDGRKERAELCFFDYMKRHEANVNKINRNRRNYVD